MRRDNPGAGLVIGLVIFGIIIGALAAALGAVFLMFGLALVHRDVAAVPPLGFISSFGALIVVSAIASAARSVKVETK